MARPRRARKLRNAYAHVLDRIQRWHSNRRSLKTAKPLGSRLSPLLELNPDTEGLMKEILKALLRVILRLLCSEVGNIFGF